MRIAYICSDVGIPVFGAKGASVHLRAVVEALQSLGHTVKVFSPAIDPDGAVAADSTFQAVNYEGITANVSKSVAQDVPEPDHLAAEYSRLLFNEYLQRTIAPALERFQPDCIYERYSLFGYAGAEISERLGIPLLLEVNAPLTIEQQKYRRLVLKGTAEEIETRLFQRADAIFVVSEELKSFATGIGAAAARVHVLPNAVSPERFNPAVDGSVVRAQYGFDGKKVVGFVGSLKLWHDIDTLLDAIRRLYETDRDVRLLVVGDGPRLPELKAMNEEFLVCTGGVEHDDVPRYLAATDVVAVPYSLHEDQYFSPLKLFEAMAMAKPVVGARLGQVKDVLVDGVNGRLYTPDDAADLAARLADVLSAPDRGAAMGRAGLDRVLANHTWIENGRRIEKVARSLTSQLVRDERLPHLNLVWSPERMTSFLNAEAVPRLKTSPIARLELKDLTYRPARQCISLFDLAFEDGKGGMEHRRAIVSFVKDERFAAMYEKHYAGDERPRAAYLPEHRCLVELFPADWEIPSLGAVADPGSAAKLMREAGVALPDGVELTTDVLTYRAHEAAVLAYRDTHGSDFRAVVKTTSQSRKAEHVYEVSQLLQRQLDAAYVSTPAIYRPRSDRYVAFMDFAPGRSLHATLAAGTESGRRETMHLTARALTDIHRARTEMRLKEKRSLPQGLDHARERAGRLEYAAPDLGRRALAVLNRVAPYVPDDRPVLTLLHGDFKGTQLLFDKGHVAVIDLDSACVGDPAVDVGNMMADLHREAVFTGSGYSRECAETFLEAYATFSGLGDIGEFARIFRVIALVRMSVHGFRQNAHVYGEPGSQPELLLREAEACLAAL